MNFAISAVGNTSMTYCTEIFKVVPFRSNSSGLNTESLVLIAVNEATLVFINSNDSKPLPLPTNLKEHSIQRVKKNAHNFPSIKQKPSSTSLASEEQKFHIDFIIKAVDLDSYNHVNQAKYLAFFEDARALASLSNFFPHFSSSNLHTVRVREVALDHIGQAHLADIVTVYMKEVSESLSNTLFPTYDFEMVLKKTSSVLCSARILYQIPPPLSKF